MHSIGGDSSHSIFDMHREHCSKPTRGGSSAACLCLFVCVATPFLDNLCFPLFFFQEAEHSQRFRDGVNDFVAKVGGLAEGRL